MEEQLISLMSRGLRPLLPRQQYTRIMKQLGVVFERHVRGEGVTAGQLGTLYAYVQAAVDDGALGEVVSTLEGRLERLV
jgi:hypothetical protein